MIWRWRPGTLTGQRPEILKCHTCHTPQEWTWLYNINHIYYLDMSGTIQGLRRLNDTTKCREAPRVALTECQGYYRIAVTSARTQRRESRTGKRRRKEERTEVMKLGGLERRRIAFLLLFHQQHGGRGRRWQWSHFSQHYMQTHSHWLNNILIL